MAFGLLMHDNTPVDFPFRRGAAQQAAVQLGHLVMPGHPALSGRRFAGYGWVDSTGGGDDGTESNPVPGTAPQQESTGWQSLVTSTLNLGTAVAGAVAGALQPRSGPAGAYCPSGYYLNNGRCVPAQSDGGGMSTMLLVGGLGLAAILLLRK